MPSIPDPIHLAKSTLPGSTEDLQASVCGLTYPPRLSKDPKKISCPTCLSGMSSTHNRPGLPPGYYWSPESDYENLAPPRWRILGPKISGHRAEIYSSTKAQDTPEGAAAQAWQDWENLSGISKTDLELLHWAQKLVQEQNSPLLEHLPDPLKKKLLHP
jgi:hypothetical protein